LACDDPQLALRFPKMITCLTETRGNSMKNLPKKVARDILIGITLICALVWLQALKAEQLLERSGVGQAELAQYSVEQVSI